MQDVDTGKVIDLEVERPEWLRMWIKDPDLLRYKIETSDNDYAGKYILRTEAHFEDKYWRTVPARPPTLEIELEIYSDKISVGP